MLNINIKRIIILIIALMAINMTFAGWPGVVIGGKNTGPNARIAYALTANISLRAITTNIALTANYTEWSNIGNKPALVSTDMVVSTANYALTASIALSAESLGGKGESSLQVGTANIALTANYTEWSSIGNKPQLVTEGMIVANASVANTANIAISMNAQGLEGAITVTTGNAVMSITALGNVGVGVATPVGKFEVAGSLGTFSVEPNVNSILLSSASPLIRLVDNNYGVANSNGWQMQSWNGNFELGTINDNFSWKDGNILFINNLGNVGIGTTAATTKLEVAGTVSASAAILEGTVTANRFVGSGSSLTGLAFTHEMRNYSTDHTLVTADVGGHLTIGNKGASAIVNITLPLGVDNNKIEFTIVVAKDLKVIAHAGQQLRFMDSSTSIGFVRSDVLGTTWSLLWNGNEWVITNLNGTIYADE